MGIDPRRGLLLKKDPVVRALALTIEGLQDAAFIATAEPEPRIVFANAAFVRLTGYRREALRGQALGFLRRHDTLGATLGRLHRDLEAEGAFFAEVSIRHRDGHAIAVEWQATRLAVDADADTGPAHLLCLLRDVSARREAQATLSRERERLRAALACVGDAVICLDGAGRIEEINPAAEKMTGWTKAAVVGLSASEVLRFVDFARRAPIASPAAACLASGRPQMCSGPFVLIGRHNRETIVSALAAPLREPAAADNPVRGAVGEAVHSAPRGAVLVLRGESPRRASRSTDLNAARDALTGLINRREFERRLENAISGAGRNGRRQVLCYIDLDHFRLINEVAGHAAGDTVLRQVASLLRARFRQRDTLARLGGDEFALLLDNCGLDEAEGIAKSILESFAAARFAVPGTAPLRVAPSIGLVEVTTLSGSAPQLLSRGDLACYTAKELGRGRSHIYRSDSVNDAPAALLNPRAFRAALAGDRFQLYYQPIVPLDKNAGLAVHYEFLLRLRSETGELILPRTLIAAAERHGLMGAVDRWVIRAALRQLADPQGRFAAASIAINLSGNSLDDPGLVDYVVAQFAEHPIAPRAVCFEITETEAIRDLGHAVEVVSCLKQLGCSIALDDFGSGQSSFAYLKALPADYLKIDGGFVRRMIDSPVDRAVVSAIHETGRIMGLRTIAEFAHDDATIACLRGLGVDYAQGDAVAPPRPVPALRTSPSPSIAGAK